MPHTNVESVRAILRGCANPTFHYSGMTPEEVRKKFGWRGLRGPEIERVATISEKFGDECRDQVFSLVCYTKRLPKKQREAIWQMLEGYNPERDGSPHPFIKRVFVEKLGWGENFFRRDKLDDVKQ